MRCVYIVLLREGAIWSITSYYVSYCLLKLLFHFSSEKCSECGMEGNPRQEFVQGWTQGQGTYMIVSVCIYACHLQIVVYIFIL